MHVKYGKNSTDLTPLALGDAAYLAIGRLIRACAELEDMVGLFLCDLSNITEAQALILLGRTPVSQKIKIASVFAVSGNAKEAFGSCFDNQHYKAIVQCRNAVAHGVYLGITDVGNMAFRVSDVIGNDESKLSILVHSYGLSDLEGFADMAEQSIPQIENILHLAESRAERWSLGLHPHRKAQPTRTPSEKHERQGPPSGK